MMRRRPRGRLRQFRTQAAEIADAVVTAVAPRYALRRRMAREALDIFQSSSYHGASQDRNYEDWTARDGSADAVNDKEYRLLRLRARERERNDAHAQAIVQTMCDNVVGTGIRPQSRPDMDTLGIGQDEAEEWSAACERVWAEAVPLLDATGRLTHYQQQQQVFCRAYVDGDIFLNRLSVRGPNRPISTTFEMVEGERVESPSFRLRREQKRVIREGVELGRRHQPVAYWVRLDHPRDVRPSPNHDRSFKFARIRARNTDGDPLFLHVYRPSRPQQTRGVTSLAPALKLFKLLDDYLEAELVGKRMEACYGVIKEVDPMSELASQMLGNGKTYSGDASIKNFHPGMEARLLPGEKLHFVDPKRPGTTFDPFVTRMLLAIGASVSVPYIILLKDYNRTSYSSYRGALLDFLRHCESWRDLLVTSMCQPIWEAVMLEAWASGLLPPVDLLGNKAAWLRTQWLPQKRDWVDPDADSKSEALGLESRTKTYAEIIGARGGDWAEHLRQSVREEKYLRDLREESGLDIHEEDPPEGEESEEPDEAEELEEVAA